MIPIPENLEVGDLVNLWSLPRCKGRIMATGRIEKIDSLDRGGKLVWVLGRPAHHSSMVELISKSEERG